MNFIEKTFGVKCIECEGYHKRITDSNGDTIKNFCSCGFQVGNPKDRRRCFCYDKIGSIKIRRQIRRVDK